MQALNLSHAQKLAFKQLLALKQTLKHPEVPNAKKGLEGMLAADKILKKRYSSGILIGGLAESVADCSPDLYSGLGFVFERYDPDDLLQAMRRALAAFQKKDLWRKLMRRGMQADYSWKSSLPKYEILYETAQHKVL